MIGVISGVVGTVFDGFGDFFNRDEKRKKKPTGLGPVGFFDEEKLQAFQRFLNLFEVRQVLRAFLHFGVLNDALFIDDKGGTFRDAAKDQVFRRQELFVSDAVGFRDFVFVVGQERDGDAFLFRPLALSEWTVSRDAEDLRVETVIGAQSGRKVAQFGGADAGEGGWEEHEDDV